MALRAVPEHPKFAALKMCLGIPKFEALGLLESLWHFTGKFAPRGNVGKFTNAQIEAWLEWRGAPGAAIEALVESGWIDKSEEFRLAVHDWKDHADATTKKYMGRTKAGFVQDMSDANGKDDGPPEPVPVPVPEPVPVPAPKTLASTAVAVPAGKLVCTIPLNQGDHEVFDADVQGWTALYPAVDVRQELRTMKGWLQGSPQRRKTRSGIGKFMNAWFARAQNEGGRSGNKGFKTKSDGIVDAVRTALETTGNRDSAGEAGDSPAGSGWGDGPARLLEGSVEPRP